MLAGLVEGAEWVVIRIVHEDDRDWFGGYVAIDASGLVLEKSDTYGVYEEEADQFDGYGDDCLPATRIEFSEAWNRPYAKRSRWRRFLANLNGASDTNGDPSEGDLLTG
jgi:hypothetical protein